MNNGPEAQSLTPELLYVKGRRPTARAARGCAGGASRALLLCAAVAAVSIVTASSLVLNRRARTQAPAPRAESAPSPSVGTQAAPREGGGPAPVAEPVSPGAAQSEGGYAGQGVSVAFGNSTGATGGPGSGVTVSFGDLTAGDSSAGSGVTVAFQNTTGGAGDAISRGVSVAFQAGSTPTPTPAPCDISLDGDEDGIPDCWEARGVDYDNNGTVDLRLPGANPIRKDIYLEVDYMKAGDHTHKPRSDSLSEVQAAFARAPIDGGLGINLHIVVDEEIGHHELIGFGPASPCGAMTSFDSLKDTHFGTAAEHAEDNPNRAAVLAAKRRVYRYAIFAHRHGNSEQPCTSSGVARSSPRGDFVVSLASFNDFFEKFKNSDCRFSLDAFQCGQKNMEAGTFMHELGHGLGLGHGGAADDNVNCKPNYLSVMSYSLQFPTYDPTRPLDYSRAALATLEEEGLLDESVGVKGPKGRYVVYGAPRLLEPDIGVVTACKDGFCAKTARADGPINWDNSLSPFHGRNVSANVNRVTVIPKCKEGAGHTLKGFDDWGFIGESLAALTSGLPATSFASGPLTEEELEQEEEMTPEELLASAESIDFDGDGVSNADDNCPSVHNPDQADGDGNGVGNLCQTAASADLSVALAISQSPVLIGSNVTYVMTVANNGPDAAAPAVVTNNLPAETTFVSCEATGGGACGGAGNGRTVTFASLAGGASATITLVATVNGNITDGAVFTDTASVSSQTSDLNTTNNAAAAAVVALNAQKNPVDASAFFVRQHYHDFLNREPDAPGLQFWTGEIEQCGADAQCREVKQVNVSAAFYLSIEFQQTGYLAYRAYKAAYGNAQGKPVPITREEILSDMRRIGDGVVVGQENWESRLEQNKKDYFDLLVTRERFTTLYPQSLTPAQFVDALNANAGVALTPAERDALAGDLAGGVRTRAQVLRAVAEDNDLARAEFNRAFVLMQYFGYLRRNPNDPPDADFSGWQFWLSKLEEFHGNFIKAEMVRAFISSIEYRRRFSQ